MSTGSTTQGIGTQASSGIQNDDGQTGRLESFTYDDAIVRKFAMATVVWGIVGMLVGVILAFQLVLPRAVPWHVLREVAPDGSFVPGSGYKPFAWLSFLLEVPWLNFGRLRPLHTNAVIFAFAGNAIFAAVYYSTQRLCKARMWSDLLSNLHFWGWQLIIVSAAVTLPLGITQSKEYAELEWPIDLAIAVVWLGFFGTNFFMTLVKRRERHLYVALWFYIATIVTVTILHVFNNLWIPVGVWEFLTTGSVGSPENILKSYPVYAGVQDAFMQWWYGHNAVAFFLTTPFLGLMYYFLPKAANRPVFSYRLSIVHFWSLVFIYIWAGPHHLHYTALPMWASSLGMVFSVMLWMPSWGGMINGLLTLRGAWHKVTQDPVLKFFVIGVTFYGMSTFEGPLLSVRTVNALSHYTDWTIAHVHSGTLGWNGFMTFGMLYWLAPRIFQTRELFSKKLAEWHFWMGTIGLLLYIIPIYTAGITQGLMWRAFTDEGTLKYPEFVETVTQLMPFYWVRLFGGTLYLVGVVLGGYNLLRTWMARPSTYEEPVHRAAPLAPVYADTPIPGSRLHANIGVGHRGDVWLQGFWHRKLERLPVRFTIWVLIAVGVASLIEIIPTFLIRSNIPTIKSVRPYTPLELAGRDMYVSEGCYNCHSQMIRPFFAEVKRYGEYSKPGEFVYDHPFQWGSRRIGPDLAREGGKQSELWHAQHFLNPTEFNAGSIMPSYAFLLRREFDFGRVRGSVRAMSALGVPYTEQELENAEALARAQALDVYNKIIQQNAGSRLAVSFREVLDENGEPVYDEFGSITLEPTQFLEDDAQALALIAYLQRLGIDISGPEPVEGEGETPEFPTQVAEDTPRSDDPGVRGVSFREGGGR